MEQALTDAVAPGVPDLSVVVTGHREGRLAHHTMRSLAIAVQHARSQGLTVEVVCVLDRPDADTVHFFTEATGPDGYFAGLCTTTVFEVDHGDPGLARNDAVQRSHGRLVGMVDSDNLVSIGWLTSAAATIDNAHEPLIVHPEYLVTFGAQHVVWMQVPTSDPDFSIGAFYSFNYWDTICVAPREVFLEHPYVTSVGGFGPEDWHWNTLTLADGLTHTTAPETALFYRVKRQGSRNQELVPTARPIERTPLLTSREVAIQSLHRAAHVEEVAEPTVTTALVEAALEEFHSASGAGATGTATRLVTRFSQLPAAPPPARSVGLGRRRPKIVAEHYRAIHDDLAHLDDDELLTHYETFGRSEGRRPFLSAEELERLQSDQFVPSHYRVLHPDLAEMGDGALARHFLAAGRVEARRAALTTAELEALERFDVAEYRLLNRDIDQMTDDELVAHFVEHGLAEGRRTRLTRRERAAAHQPAPEWLVEESVAAHSIEPAVPVLSPEVWRSFGWYLAPEPDDPRDTVWWQVVDALPDTVDYLFFAPWVRMGGGDAVLARYARLMCERHPDANVAVITTEADSTRTEWLPSSVHLVELTKIEGFQRLTPAERAQLAANLIVQYAPRTVHILNSPIAFEAVEHHAEALSRRSRLFLSTFVIERGPHGELYNWMFKRHPRFLDHVSGVIVDNAPLVRELWDLYRYPREKFFVHHQPVELPELTGPDTRTDDRGTTAPAARGIDVLWAARFDRQKRPDVLARIAEATHERGMSVRFHVYGDTVMGAADEFAADLERLRELGATFYNTYKSFAELPPSRFDVFLMTSQWEGIPLTLLDAMAYGLPVVAANVGGVTEVLDDTTGYPVARCDDIEAYLDGLAIVLQNPDVAHKWTIAARQRLAESFSQESWRRAVDETPGYLEDHQV